MLNIHLCHVTLPTFFQLVNLLSSHCTGLQIPWNFPLVYHKCYCFPWVLLVAKNQWTTTKVWRDRQIRDRCELFLEHFFPLLCCQCHGWYGIFSFITLDSHCPSLSYRLSSHLYLCGRAEKMAWCLSQKWVVWQPSGKESCTGALAASAVTDHRDFQALS